MSKEIHKETATTVFTGLIINYPLQVLLLYIMLDILKWEDSFTIATTGVAEAGGNENYRLESLPLSIPQHPILG